MADASRIGSFDLPCAFIFVPRGAASPIEWTSRHPGWVKIPATMVPRQARPAGRFGLRQESPRSPGSTARLGSGPRTPPAHDGMATPVSSEDPDDAVPPTSFDDGLIGAVRSLLTVLGDAGEVRPAIGGPAGYEIGSAMSGLAAMLAESAAAGAATVRTGRAATALGADAAVRRAAEVPQIEAAGAQAATAAPGEGAIVAGSGAPVATAPQADTAEARTLAQESAPARAGLPAGERPAPGPAFGRIDSSIRAGKEARIVARDPQARELIKRVAKEGDPSGRLTEQAVELIVKDEGLESLAGGRDGGKRGFDHVFRDPDGFVTLLMDSEPVQGGPMRLAKEGAGNRMQMSDEWITAMLGRLDQSSEAAEAIIAARKQGTLAKAVIGVDRESSNLVLVPVQRER